MGRRGIGPREKAEGGKNDKDRKNNRKLERYVRDPGICRSLLRGLGAKRSGLLRGKTELPHRLVGLWPNRSPAFNVPAVYRAV